MNKKLFPVRQGFHFFRNFRFLAPMFRDARMGKYKKIPWKSAFGIFAAVLYVITPLDLIPEFIIGFGFIDDFAVSMLAMKAIDMDIEHYKMWQKEQEIVP